MVTSTRKTVPADTLGARVRAARQERGMSQAQLAGEELTKGFISQLESGSVRPSIRSLQLIASRLAKSLDYFLGDEPLSLQKRLAFFDLAAQKLLVVRLRPGVVVTLAPPPRGPTRATKATQHDGPGLPLATRHSDMRSVARSLTGIAVSLYDSGELDGAIANYRRALDL